MTSGNWKKGFWAFTFTHFQVAFSDNLFKSLLTFLMIAVVNDPEGENRYLSLIQLLFAVPFLLFSMYGGFFADRYSKRSVTIAVKTVEIALMGVAAWALGTHSLGLGFVVLFFLATHSAVYGPSKYGILPELLPHEELSWGNGIFEMMTFVAIVAGGVVGGILMDHFESRLMVAGWWLIGISLAGWVLSWGITRVPPADPNRSFKWNFVSDVFRQIVGLKKDRVLALAVCGAVYFWFVGALLLSNILAYGNQLLHLSTTQISVLNAALTVGIGLGSVSAGYLSGHKIEYGLIPLGALGMTVFCLVMAWPGLADVGGGLAAWWGVPTPMIGGVAGLAALGFWSGFFIVPINALVQQRPLPGEKGRVIATQNILTMVGVAVAAGYYFVLSSPALFHLSPRGVFLACGVTTIAATAYIVTLLPDALIRLVMWMVTHTVYRIRVTGLHHIPQHGGGLLVANHTSFADALLIMSSTDRRVRFLADEGLIQGPIARVVAKAMGVIPISSKQGPREMIRSLREATEAIRSGRIVCIFAEGQITRTGQLLPFRRGYQRIMKGLDAPIIPIHLNGLWGSITSFEGGRFFLKWPKQIPYPVRVSVGAPLPAEVEPWKIRRTIQELGTEADQENEEGLIPIHRALIRLARRRWRAFAMADFRVARLSWGGALVKTIVVARALKSRWEGQEMVGILLPPSVAGSLVNYAALLAGKIPVNLNYTASNSTLEACAIQCGIKTVVTSKMFLEKVNLQVPGEAVYLEEVTAEVGIVAKVTAVLGACCLPAVGIEKLCGRAKPADLRDTATVIFSSGSTGDPKGVMLTHRNVAANVKGLDQVFHLETKDKVMGILPFFHSFGFTGTLALPAYTGIGVVFHPTPLDGRVIGGLIERYGVTFLLATPTFLQLYMRACQPEQLGSLRLVMTGAEKLPERLAQGFEDKFGITPLEGYGCTECAPVVSVNRPDFRAKGFRQIGRKRGSIGHPLPGVSIRVVDPDTRVELGPNQPGVMWVKGANVMAGYLGKEEKTREVIQEGWYVTGDVAKMDEDGFLTITDRLTRFSKIGGEMVPHIKVEEMLHEAAGLTEQTFVVAGVPDEKKGERLVVLYTCSGESLPGWLEKLAAAGLPNLCIPKVKDCYRVEAIPYLGTGKLDLQRVKQAAAACAAGSSKER